MIKKKIEGIFVSLDEALTVKYLCERTNESTDTVEAVIEELRKEGKISGKRKIKYTKNNIPNVRPSVGGGV